MARKPNYGLNRSDVNRAKQAKQDEKLRAQEEAVARRRALREAEAAPPSPPAEDAPMARRQDDGKFVLFDVTYADGSRRSNRKVPSELLGGLDGDAPARTEIEAQDARIAQASGKPAQEIVSLVRAGR